MNFQLMLSIFILMIAVGVGSGQKGPPPTITLTFTGNRAFSEEQLRSPVHQCLASYSRGTNRENPEAFEYCLGKLKHLLFSKGYLQAVVGEPKREQTNEGLQITVPITEGVPYRIGSIEIKDSRMLTATQIREMLTMQTGDIVNQELIENWLQKRVRQKYDSLGFVHYSADIEPAYYVKEGAKEGTVDFTVTIDEGPAFTIRLIQFQGNDDIPEESLLQQMLLRPGDVFNKQLLIESLKIINATGQFETIDPDKDVEYKGDDENSSIELVVRLKKKSLKGP